MKRYITITFFILLLGEALAQDIHFSQFGQAPLNLNPALTGQFDGNIRAVLNHRSQWASLSDPFVTSAISLDSKLWQARYPNEDFGLGVLLLTDQSGDADLVYSKFMLSAAYARPVSKNGNHTFGFGLQGGFFQRNIDENKLYFASQFEDDHFDLTAPSGERFVDLNVLKTDLQAGIVYKHQVSDDYRLIIGTSVYHLLNPNETLINGDSRLTLKEVFHAESMFKLTDKTSVGGELLFQNQNDARETIIGGIIEQGLLSEAFKDIVLIFSPAYRWKDAVIIKAGMYYKNWRFGFNYDINASSLVPASRNRGGFEISIIYIDRWLTSEKKLPVVLPCPRI